MAQDLMDKALGKLTAAAKVYGLKLELERVKGESATRISLPIPEKYREVGEKVYFRAALFDDAFTMLMAVKPDNITATMPLGQAVSDLRTARPTIDATSAILSVMQAGMGTVCLRESLAKQTGAERSECPMPNFSLVGLDRPVEDVCQVECLVGYDLIKKSWDVQLQHHFYSSDEPDTNQDRVLHVEAVNGTCPTLPTLKGIEVLRRELQGMADQALLVANNNAGRWLVNLSREGIEGVLYPGYVECEGVRLNGFDSSIQVVAPAWHDLKLYQKIVGVMSLPAPEIKTAPETQPAEVDVDLV